MKNIIQQLFGNTLVKKTNAQFAWVEDLAEMDDIAALKFCYQQLATLIAQMQSDQTMDYQALLDLLIRLEDQNFSRLEKRSEERRVGKECW